MYKIAKPLFLHCLTPMHAGSGSDLGIIDLPIQRERHTSFPKIESSSLKGALREATEFNAVVRLVSADKEKARKNLMELNRVFGYDDGSIAGFNKKDFEEGFTIEDGDKKKTVKDFAGAIGFTDARLLLFPIKSMKGVFVWATCQQVLKQLHADLSICQPAASNSLLSALAGMEDVATNECWTSSNIAQVGANVILEEYTFKVSEKKDAKKLAEELGKVLSISGLADKLVVLPNDDFKDFVNLSTEVITRTKLDNETGTVATGALFTEEYLPSESVMYSLVMAHDEFRAGSDFTAEKVLGFFEQNLPRTVQIGGNMTLGKGLTSVIGLSEIQ